MNQFTYATCLEKELLCKTKNIMFAILRVMLNFSLMI